MHINIKTTNAIRLMLYCALNDGKLSKTREVASVINASENHMAKIGNELTHAGLLEAVRGRNGGVRLGRDPAEIRLGDITRAIQAPEMQGDPCWILCHDGETDACPLIGVCSVHGIFGEALVAFSEVLDRYTLQDVMKNGFEQRHALGLTGLVLPWVGASGQGSAKTAS